MKNTFKYIAHCTLLVLIFIGCRKTDHTEIPAGNPAISTAAPGTPEQTAQSVMYRFDIEYGEVGEQEIENPPIVRADLTLAAESFVLNKKFPVNGKYSFSLLDSKGRSQISDLQYSYDSNTWFPLPYSIISGCKDPGILSIDYWSSQTFGTAQSYLREGLIGSILASDDTPKNDNACGNADIAIVPLTALLVNRDGILIKGTINGNETSDGLFFIATVSRSAESVFTISQR